MDALVTGAAGFVGSHLCRRLLDAGDRVRGVDVFTPYYDRRVKEDHLRAIGGHHAFTFLEADLVTTDLGALLDDVDVVFHLAGQPGVRASWGREFDVYLRDNVAATQRLLEAVAHRNLRKFVYASSSSVYGDAEAFPTAETVAPRPVSPYGVTKLAAEHLCELYRANLGVPTASLRLFTVYGPGQRPDMAFSRLVSAAVDATPFTLFGDGRQTRDFTYVDDVTRAMQDCARSTWCGVANVGGGSTASMQHAIDVVASLCGPIPIQQGARQQGDARHTSADIRVARAAFGYQPATSLHEGLDRMVRAATTARTGAVPVAR